MRKLKYTVMSNVEVIQLVTGIGQIIAVAIIPIIVWFIGIKYQNRKAKKDAQMSLFLTLMANRKSNPITKEWVDALNTIDVVFQENNGVRHAWREYLDSLNEKSPHFLKQTEIDRFYSPKYFGSQMSRQEIMFQEYLRVLMHSRNFSEGFSEEEYQSHYNNLIEKDKNT